MRHFQFLQLLFLMLFLSNASFAQSSYRVTEQRVSVRNKPSSTALVVGVLNKDEVISVKEINNGWATFSFRGQMRYVSASDIEKAETEAADSINSIPEEEQTQPSEEVEVILNPADTIINEAEDIIKIGESPTDEPLNVSKTESIQEQDYEPTFSTIEAGYSASSFDDVKLSGSYGVSYAITWALTRHFYTGLHFSPLNFNFGLVPSDFTSDVIKLGPALGFRFAPAFSMIIPIDILCAVYFQDSDTKTAWGMELAPSFYVGKKWGIYAGPTFTMGFQGESKISCGFRAGIYFTL